MRDDDERYGFCSGAHWTGFLYSACRCFFLLPVGHFGIFRFSHGRLWHILQIFEGFFRKDKTAIRHNCLSDCRCRRLDGNLKQSIGFEYEVADMQMKTDWALQQCILSMVCMALCFFQSGCGLFTTMGTPTRYEERIPAEYKLSDLENEKMLVLVNQHYWLDANVNLRVAMTEALYEQLIKNVDLTPDRLIGYNKLSKYRSQKPDFSLLKADDVGRALEADVVLFVNIGQARLENVPDTDIYSGFLSARASLVDVSSGAVLWPEQSKPKSIKVGFEVEEKGLNASTSRLSRSAAHCIVRYLYDCKTAYFKTADDRSAPQWEYWK